MVEALLGDEDDWKIWKEQEVEYEKKYIGQRGISLSGSYQQGYSTAYNTRSHIKVVCNGYILTHVLN